MEPRATPEAARPLPPKSREKRFLIAQTAITGDDFFGGQNARAYSELAAAFDGRLRRLRHVHMNASSPSTNGVPFFPRGRAWILRTLVALATFAVLFGSSASARATPSARFIYVRGKGTETCPSEQAVRHAVHVRLGYDPFSIFATSTMFAEVASAKGGYTANLKLVDAENTVRGDRVLKVQGDCAELMDAMALTISIAIDPMSVTRSARPAEAPPPEGDIAPSPTSSTSMPESSRTQPPSSSMQEESLAEASAAPDESDRTRAGAAESARSRAPALHVSLWPLVNFGSAPAPSVGGAFAVEGSIGRIVGAIEGRADLPSSARASEVGRVQSSLLAGAVFAGVRAGPVFGGAVGMLGRLAATSSDVAESRDQDGLLVATGLRVGIAIPISQTIEARARAEILANLLRHTLEISDREVFAYPIALGSVGLGLAVRFW
jgi:microcompartment protein CcmL/EutN